LRHDRKRGSRGKTTDSNKYNNTKGKILQKRNLNGDPIYFNPRGVDARGTGR